MNKKILSMCALVLALLFAFAACAPAQEASATPTPTPDGAIREGEETQEGDACGPTIPGFENEEGALPPQELNVAALFGPTGIGMVKLMEDRLATSYVDGFHANFSLVSAPDEITGKLITGELDIACVPTNLAAVLYQKTEGGVQLAALNTLGVLYVLEKGNSVQSMADLSGKKLLATGEASMPEYIIDYLLAENGLSDEVEVEYLTEHAELAAKTIAGDVELCVLPEPFVSRVIAKNPDMRVALSLTDEWNAASGAQLSMGGIVVRSELLNDPAKKAAVDAFLTAYAASAEYVAQNPEEAAKLVVKHGIMDDEALAAQVIPRCNIVFIDGEQMQTDAASLYEVLFAANPKATGGALPDDGLYYKR